MGCSLHLDSELASKAVKMCACLNIISSSPLDATSLMMKARELKHFPGASRLGELSGLVCVPSHFLQTILAVLAIPMLPTPLWTAEAEVMTTLGGPLVESCVECKHNVFHSNVPYVGKRTLA